MTEGSMLIGAPIQLAKKNKNINTEINTNTNTVSDANVNAETNTNSTVNTNTEVMADININSNINSTNTNTSISGTNINLVEEAKKINLDWNNPSWDLFLLAFFAMGALLYGVSLGKDRIIAIIVSIYMSLAVVNALPDFVLNIKFNDNFTLQVTAFISIFVVLFFLLSRSAVLNSLDTSDQGRWWQVLIFSVLHVGLLVSVSMSFMPLVFLQKFSIFTQFIFTNEWTKFGWIILPIIAMIFFGRRTDK
jgi:hypothetical protein